jgi:hypothetical protein
VGPRAGLNAVVKRRIPSPCREWKTSPLARRIITILTELPRFVCPMHAENEVSGTWQNDLKPSWSTGVNKRWSYHCSRDS